MQSLTSLSRRRLLSGAAATTVLGPSLSKAAPANGRLDIAFIGYGKRAFGVMGQALRQPDLRIVAVCEVEGTRRAKAKEVVEQRDAEDVKSGQYKGCATYVNCRELLGREDLDAVVIMTPDHMHVHPALAATAKKLDTYCEKPLTRTIAEGRLLVNSVRKNQVVLQTSSQQRCEVGLRFRKAVGLIRGNPHHSHRWRRRCRRLPCLLAQGSPPNWLDCIKTREEPICSVETGHRTATVCHLANIGYKLRRKLTWDPVKEEFPGDAEANALTGRKPREGWDYA